MLQEAQGHGLDLDGGRAGRFEQAGMKRTQLAVAGRALGKQAHRIALAETRLHGLAHRVHRVALALDEQRAGAGHQPADDGQLRISLWPRRTWRAEFSTKISIQDT